MTEFEKEFRKQLNAGASEFNWKGKQIAVKLAEGRRTPEKRAPKIAPPMANAKATQTIHSSIPSDTMTLEELRSRMPENKFLKQASTRMNSEESVVQMLQGVFGDKTPQAMYALLGKKGEAMGENPFLNYSAVNQNKTSKDLGLFQINDKTFDLMRNKYKTELDYYGIDNFEEDMVDPMKNAVTARLLAEDSGRKNWYGAPQSIKNGRVKIKQAYPNAEDMSSPQQRSMGLLGMLKRLF